MSLRAADGLRKAAHAWDGWTHRASCALSPRKKDSPACCGVLVCAVLCCAVHLCRRDLEAQRAAAEARAREERAAAEARVREEREAMAAFNAAAAELRERQR